MILFRKVTFVADEMDTKGKDQGEPVTLATLKQDCFMIPMARMTRFFPAGHPVSCLKFSFLSVMYVTSEAHMTCQRSHTYKSFSLDMAHIMNNFLIFLFLEHSRMPFLSRKYI